ncbi:MAG: MmgE/PrpD family protein [Granulosicoccaceae bacterium]
MSQRCLSFVHRLQWADVPEHARHAARRALLDLLGVAASAMSTSLSQMIRQHAVMCFASPEQGARILFDGRPVSAPGAALAGGSSIDAIDAHDGYKPAKGHVGCGVLPALLAYAEYAEMNAQEFLTCLVIGYEFGSRAGDALHGSVCDYHTSGAWVAVTTAALGGRVLALSDEQCREAMGVAEYHGPRSQMMRCIDHPTMVKDGSGWGAMAGVSAALLAREGFTGAPALTVESPAVACYWADLGHRWLVDEQYTKPYPVCRWAQPAVVAALALKATHGFAAADIEQLELLSFHESVRLSTAEPTTTEQAQYSLPFPVAAALVHGRVGVAQISEAGLADAQVLALSRNTILIEHEPYNKPFPQKRISSVRVRLRDGREFDSGPTEAAGDPEDPFSDSVISEKFFEFAEPALGSARAKKLHDVVWALGEKKSDNLHELQQLIYAPVKNA